MNPKLSIVTVNLNHREGLARTLASIHDKQSFDSFEHVVIDGGSTDGSLEVIRAYAPRLAQRVSEPDRGIYHAMNKGISLARGEFLLFLNSGDWLADDVLKPVFADFPEADVVYGNLYFCDNGQVAGPWVPPDAADLDLAFFVRGSLPHPASFIRRSQLTGRGYSESYRIVADRKFFLESFLQSGVRFAHVDRFISYYGRDGISHRPENDSLHQEEIRRLLSGYFKPSVLPLLQNHRLFPALFGQRRAERIEDPITENSLYHWINLFFWLDRRASSRAALRAFGRLVRRWEKCKAGAADGDRQDNARS